MKLLVIDGSGRGHATVWKLAQSPDCTEMYCAPGNGGIADERLKNGKLVTCLPDLKTDDLQGLLRFAKEYRPDLTIVGPEKPLTEGIVDMFEKNGLPIFGPNRQAARFEGSKAFTQDFCERHGVTVARGKCFDKIEPAEKFVLELNGRCVVKADGLADGKGALACHSAAEANEAISRMLAKKEFGPAGERIVIQKLLTGLELSLHALSDGEIVRLFPSARDHKRHLDGDLGLNTGGMGAYSPDPMFGERDVTAIANQILIPWLAGCQKEGLLYRGIIYPGIMVTRVSWTNLPWLLEFNCRFGDPEAQVYLTRLENDLLPLLEASTRSGGLKDEANVLRWSPCHSVCVVMTSQGYPGKPEIGKKITGLDEVAKMSRVKVFHAGTVKEGGDFYTSGGRVLGVTAWDESLSAARFRAYEAIDHVCFEGAHFRYDIAAKALVV